MKPLTKWVLTFSYILLLIFQIKTTNIRGAYTPTPAETDNQIQRMNYYPPSLARIGYVLETNKKTQFVRSLERNLFTVIDFNSYIPKLLPYLLSPLFFMGLYYFIKCRKKYALMFYGFILTIILMTFIGSKGKYGPVLMVPFIYFITTLPIIKLFKKL